MDKVCSFPHTTVSQVIRVRNLEHRRLTLKMKKNYSGTLSIPEGSTRVVSWRIGHPSDWSPFPFSDLRLGNIIKSHLARIRVNKFSTDSHCMLNFHKLMWISIISINTVLRLAVAKRRFIVSKDFIAITWSKTFPPSFSDPLIALLTPSLTLSSSEKKTQKGSNSLEINYTDQMIGILLLYLLFQ